MSMSSCRNLHLKSSHLLHTTENTYNLLSAFFLFSIILYLYPTQGACRVSSSSCKCKFPLSHPGTFKTPDKSRSSITPNTWGAGLLLLHFFVCFIFIGSFLPHQVRTNHIESCVHGDFLFFSSLLFLW